MKEYAFGIDLGGTTAKVGLFTTSGALLEKWEVPTDTSNAGEHILENLADAIHAKMAEKEITSEQVEGVGIGVPGPVLDSRVVPIICANLGGWGERNVSAQLSGLLDGMKVLVGNDANVAALGEIWMGTAKGCRSAVMVTLGTGVGGGVIVNGKVIDGAHGAGGEIGHITVNRHETATCGCGKHGCLEQYSSATGVVRCMKKLLDENPDADCVLRGKDFEAKDVFDAARSGDALAAREVDEMTDTLGMALATIASTTDPEMFLVGGGVARLIKSHHDEYLAAYGIDPQKVTFIPNYVSGSVFSTVDRRQVKELRSSWGLDPERFTVVCAGQLQTRKGVLEFAQIAKALPQMQFVWAGDFAFGGMSDGHKELEKLLHDHSDNLHFTGLIERKKMPQLYQLGDVMLLPSYDELFPMTVLEAMSCGKPILLRDLSLYQVILDGYYLKAADNRQFIAQLVQLSRDEAYYARACEMSARGNRFYSEEHVLGMWQEFYHLCLQESLQRQSERRRRSPVVQLAGGGWR